MLETFTKGFLLIFLTFLYLFPCITFTFIFSWQMQKILLSFLVEVTQGNTNLRSLIFHKQKKNPSTKGFSKL